MSGEPGLMRPLAGPGCGRAGLGRRPSGFRRGKEEPFVTASPRTPETLWLSVDSPWEERDPVPQPSHGENSSVPKATSNQTREPARSPLLPRLSRQAARGRREVTQQECGRGRLSSLMAAVRRNYLLY